MHPGSEPTPPNSTRLSPSQSLEQMERRILLNTDTLTGEQITVVDHSALI